MPFKVLDDISHKKYQELSKEYFSKDYKSVIDL